MIYSFCFYNSIAFFIASFLFFFYKTCILNTAGKLASNERTTRTCISSGTVQTRLFKLCTRTKILTLFNDKEASPTVKSLQEVNNREKKSRA